MERSNLGILLMMIVICQVSGKVLHAQNHNNEHCLYPEEVTAPDFDDDVLVWSDEFDTEGAIDTTKWFHQTKLPSGGSWYNNEIQHYTNRVDNSYNDTAGLLHIVAKKEEFTDQGYTKQYTSARLNSRFAFTYGKVEIRAKLPSGAGTWPAMWMLGKNVRENGGYWYTQGFGTTGWPACGEIDIMEHWGTNQDYVSSAIHTPSSYGATVNVGGRTVSGASDTFHIYKMEWTPEQLVFSIDDMVHYTYHPAEKNDNTWPFDKELYLLLNVAILPAITADFNESSLVLDYVRVYQYSTVSSVHVADSRNITYFPNPFKNEITIDLGEFPNQDITLKIYNSDARLVKMYEFPDFGNIITLENLDDLSGGLYIISYELNNTLYSFRVAKE
jgi:beta-glucanase (GH16 family)